MIRESLSPASGREGCRCVECELNQDSLQSELVPPGQIWVLLHPFPPWETNGGSGLLWTWVRREGAVDELGPPP